MVPCYVAPPLSEIGVLFASFPTNKNYTTTKMATAKSKTVKKAARKPAAKKAARKAPARKSKQNVYFFGGGKADGDGSQRNRHLEPRQTPRHHLHKL